MKSAPMDTTHKWLRPHLHHLHYPIYTLCPRRAPACRANPRRSPLPPALSGRRIIAAAWSAGCPAAWHSAERRSPRFALRASFHRAARTRRRPLHSESSPVALRAGA